MNGMIYNVYKISFRIRPLVKKLPSTYIDVVTGFGSTLVGTDSYIIQKLYHKRTTSFKHLIDINKVNGIDHVMYELLYDIYFV